jgi:acyl-CoA reductase-like NAD-dependent aldehyde dehydrogenase
MSNVVVDVFSRARAAQPAWASLPVSRRCRVIAALRRELARRSDAIARVIAQETGKPILDALSGDVLVTLEHLRYCQLQAARALRPRRVRRSRLFYAGTQFEEYREPHGVVLVFGPANYPLQLSLVPAATALVAGNAVILKCSERAPATAALIDALCVTAGVPRDLIQVLDDGPEVASELMDAGPDFVFFTGSSRNGQQVAERAAHHMIPGVFELGGKDPALVFADGGRRDLRCVQQCGTGVCGDSPRLYREHDLQGVRDTSCGSRRSASCGRQR